MFLKIRSLVFSITHVHGHLLHDVGSTWCSRISSSRGKLVKESPLSKALEELPESNLGHLVGGQAAAESVGDGGGDGACDGGLDLASEGRNEDRTNYPAKDVLGVSV